VLENIGPDMFCLGEQLVDACTITNNFGKNLLEAKRKNLSVLHLSFFMHHQNELFLHYSFFMHSRNDLFLHLHNALLSLCLEDYPFCLSSSRRRRARERKSKRKRKLFHDMHAAIDKLFTPRSKLCFHMHTFYSHAYSHKRKGKGRRQDRGSKHYN
jgi:hypothetical protein